MLAFAIRTLWLAVCWAELAVFTLFLYLLAWLPRRLTGRWYHRLFRLWCSAFVRALGVDLHLHEKNVSLLPPQYILVANHPSAFEDVGIPSLFDVYPLAKHGVMEWFLVGRINLAANTVFVDRDDPESRHAALETLLGRLQQGRNVALFPEGGCKGSRIFSSFQSGAFDLAIRTGIPIVPVFLHYEAQKTFEWRSPQTLPQKLWHFVTSPNNRANYYLYDAIDPKGFTDKKVFAEHVRQRFLEWQAR